ncbi:hypothetical protein ACLI4Y_01040 [Natrialbaceae archaeon A-CW3]
MADDAPPPRAARLAHRGLQAMGIGFLLSGIGVALVLLRQGALTFGFVALPPLFLGAIGLSLLVAARRRAVARNV